MSAVAIRRVPVGAGRSLLAAGALLVAGLSGCGSPAPGSGEIVLRFAQDDSGEFLDEGNRLYVSREVLSWDLGEEKPGIWSIGAEPERIRRKPRELWIYDVDAPVTLTRPVQLDSRELHAFEATAGGFPKGRIRLCWAPAGEEISSSRCVDQRGLGGMNRVYTFQVARHPRWSGSIGRLQLQVHPASPSQRIRIGLLTALRHELDEARLAAALKRGWKVTFDQSPYRDTRTVLLAPPGLAIERRLRVPERAVFRFGYGVEAGVPEPVCFQVTVRRPRGESTVVFERSLGRAEAQQWQEGRVELAEFAGETVDLRLVTETPEPIDLARGFPLWAHPEVVAPASQGRTNLVLISVDTLRADHLSLYGYERETSPHLDAWARACGTTFESVVASAPWTIPSHASMFSGLDALHHGANHEARVPTSLITLAEILRDAGYTTVGITGGGYVNASYGFSQGFDHYLAWRSPAAADAEPETNVEEALGWLEAHRESPFFLFFHTYALHTPYRFRQPHLSRFRDLGEDASPRWIGTRLRERGPEDGFLLTLDWIWLDDPARKREGTPLAASEFDWGRDLYDGGIAHMDVQMGHLFAGLSRLGLDRSTVMILTSDHGENLGEKGLVGHTNLYDTNLLVPLVVARPGCRSGGRRVGDQVRSVDITPTALELLGVAAPAGLDGVSLVPLLEGRPANVPREAWSYAGSSNYGVSVRVGGRLKYIFNNTAWDPLHGVQELYLLSEDAAEDKNVVSGDRRAGQLRRRVEERLALAAEGVRLRFSNQQPVAFQGQFEPAGSGWSKRWAKVKSWNLPAGSLHRAPSGAIAFRVEPHDTFDVVLELPTREGFIFEGALEGGARFSAKLDLGGEQSSWQLLYAGDSWQEGGELSEAGAVTGIVATWHEKAAATEDHSAQADSELLEQLRALGYVD